MRLNSLAFRLLATSAVWLLIVLPITGAVLNSLYRSEVERTFMGRMEVALQALLVISFNEGALEPRVSKEFGGDELFNLPLTGWYWQIAPVGGAAGRALISPSLLDGVLTFPAASATQPPGKPYRVADGTGPNGEPIRMMERELTFGSGSQQRRYSYIVTGRLADVEEAVASFLKRLEIALAVLGLGLAVATLFQVRFGLRPLSAIERGLAAIRAGEAARLEGDLPAEILPLQRELNALIKSNMDIIERARTHVGNLAHALKTPLSVITNEAAGDPGPLASKVREQAGIMRDQIGHHLDRARMVARRGSIGGVTEVQPVVAALVRVLGKIHGGRGLELTSDCAAPLRFQGERQDLEEMLGNLLDNACKWARGRVRVDVRLVPGKDRRSPSHLLMSVDDDGPGISEAERAQVVKRGRRLDETKPGSGLGLSIVTDLAGLYGGRLDLAQSDLGGLSARLTLPAA